MKRFRRLVLALAALAALAVAGAGELLSRPARRAIGGPPPDLGARSVLLGTPAGGSVRGWLVPGRPGFGALLLLHGVRSDRRQMLGRARFLKRLGYGSLLLDLPAHGESTGSRITFGYREAEGVRAALAYLRQELPEKAIGVVGVSVGAAAIVLSRPSPAPDAVVLESMFPTIEEAVADRLAVRLGPLAQPLAPLLLWQLPLRLGLSAEDIRPIAALPALQSPLLLAAGDQDRHTTLRETERLFKAANAPKELWIVPGAAHVDLHAFGPRAYEARVGAFLGKYLHSSPAPRVAGPTCVPCPHPRRNLAQ